MKESAEMVYITGDIHGDTTPVHDLFHKCQPTENDIIVLLGDVELNYTGQIRDRLMKQELSRLKSTFSAFMATTKIDRRTLLPIRKCNGTAAVCCMKRIFQISFSR